MNSSFISQIVLVIVAILVAFMYIRPGFSDISVQQDEYQQIQSAIATADEFSRTLNQLQSQVASISQSDRDALETYLPDEADQITTMWILDTVASEAGVQIDSISVADNDSAEDGGANDNDFDTVAGESIVGTEAASGVTFSVDVSGSYNAFKEFLRLIEQNEFPLLPQKLTIGESVDNGEGNESESAGEVYSLELLVPVYSPQENDRQEVEDEIMDI